MFVPSFFTPIKGLSGSDAVAWKQASEAALYFLQLAAHC